MPHIRQHFRLVLLVGLLASCNDSDSPFSNQIPPEVVREVEEPQDRDLAIMIDQHILKYGGESSPMNGLGKIFVEEGRKRDVDPRFLVAIAWHESHLGADNCQQLPSSNIFNAWGIGAGDGTCYVYDDWRSGIRGVTWNLYCGKLYFVAGLTNVEQIATSWTSGDRTKEWITTVTQHLTEMEGHPEDVTFPLAINVSKDACKLESSSNPNNAALVYSTVSLLAVSNSPIDWLESPPQGNVELNGIPFFLNDDSPVSLATRGYLSPERPTSGRIGNLQITNPQTAYILLSGGWLIQPFVDQKIGEFDFGFSDGSGYIFEVIAGVHIRETWHYINPEQQNPYNIIYQVAPSDNWRNVWEENQVRGGEAAIAYLDMLIISFPTEFSDKTLITINIRDTSSRLELSPDVALHIAGITIAHR